MHWSAIRRRAAGRVVYQVPWSCDRGGMVHGVGIDRQLTIKAWPPDAKPGDASPGALIPPLITLPESVVAGRPGRIAEAIARADDDPVARDHLPSWPDAKPPADPGLA